MVVLYHNRQELLISSLQINMICCYCRQCTRGLRFQPFAELSDMTYFLHFFCSIPPYQPTCILLSSITNFVQTGVHHNNMLDCFDFNNSLLGHQDDHLLNMIPPSGIIPFSGGVPIPCKSQPTSFAFDSIQS